MKRWPIIRHIRYFYYKVKVYEFAAQCGALGLGFGYPNPGDLDHLQKIWKGEA